MNKLNLPKDEMAFRKIYKDLVANEKITTVFRPGKRVCGDFRGYCLGEIVTIRTIEQVGADWASLAPKFDNNFFKKIEITGTTTFKIKELTEADFVGSSPDIKDIESLKYHLGTIYNLSIEDVDEDAIVTKIQFKYKN